MTDFEQVHRQLDQIRSRLQGDEIGTIPIKDLATMFGDSCGIITQGQHTMNAAEAIERALRREIVRRESEKQLR